MFPQRKKINALDGKGAGDRGDGCCHGVLPVTFWARQSEEEPEPGLLGSSAGLQTAAFSVKGDSRKLGRPGPHRPTEAGLPCLFSGACDEFFDTI